MLDEVLRHFFMKPLKHLSRSCKLSAVQHRLHSCTYLAACRLRRNTLISRCTEKCEHKTCFSIYISLEKTALLNTNVIKTLISVYRIALFTCSKYPEYHTMLIVHQNFMCSDWQLKLVFIVYAWTEGQNGRTYGGQGLTL